MDPEPASTPYDSSQYAATKSQPPNPYARTPSKRAISCVTCAKAKTKCNKALPSCSRCLTKGIKCEPRSTRRTSDNNNRLSIKKRSTPKRYHSMSSLSHVGQSASPQILPILEEDEYRRSMSYDCCTTAKMDQQALILSGFPILTPLPTHIPYLADRSYSHSDSLENNLVSFGQTTSNTTLSSLGRLSPPTPEPMALHEPIPTVHCIDYNSGSETWYEDVRPSVEYGFDPAFTEMLPPEICTMPNNSMATHSTQVPWPQTAFAYQQEQTPSEFSAYQEHGNFFPGTQVESNDCYSNPMLDWTTLQSNFGFSNATPAPFVSDMESVWKGSFTSEPLSYDQL